VELYEAISKELLPTPAKSHYTFNLRDISKVFQGILMVKPVSVQTPETATKLWIHEAQRCFADRLICDEDRLWFSRKLTSLVNKQFGLAWTHEELFEREEKIMWGDWYRPGLEKQYELDTKGKQVALLLDEYLDEYNLGTQNKQNLVFFADAIEHISRIVRVLRQPRGNLMLVGVGGSGKQSLTRLACFMSEMKCCELEISRGFGYSDFQEHLKKMMVLAGVGGRETVFLFTENQIVEERMLEDVSGILNSGEVPNLFPQDELVKIIDDLTPVVRDMGLPLVARSSTRSSCSASGISCTSCCACHLSARASVCAAASSPRSSPAARSTGSPSGTRRRSTRSRRASSRTWTSPRRR